jgi:hypothetical protein
MLKSKLVALFLLACATAFAAPEFGVTVGTSSTKIAPERGTMYAVNWTNGIAVAQGQILSVGNAFYMAETGMVTSATAPAADANYRALGSNLNRASLVLCNTSANVVWLNIGGPAALNKGIRLPAYWSIVLDEIQAPVFAISTASSLVTGVDVVKQ